MNETRQLAEFVVNLRYEDLSPTVVQMAKNCVFDLLACEMGGVEESPARIMRKTIAAALCGTHSEDGGAVTGHATVFCAEPFKTDVLNACLINGTTAHALDMDDVINTSQGHPGPPIIPAAIAAAEKTGASGAELITAIVAGYEVYTRVAESVLPEAYYFWHVTGTAGAFGAAAAAGKLLGLSVQEMIYALGSAGTQTSGLFEFLKDGANSKTLHAGKANYNGMLSALLSKNGFTAAERILEGEKGFCRAMSKEPKLELITKDLGKDYKILHTSFKPYPCCRWTHAMINAALSLREEEKVDYREIASIYMRAHPTAVDITGNDNPKTVYGCKFSIQYCTAVALIFGQVGISHFTEEAMSDDRIRNLMKITRVEALPEARSGKEINYSELYITLKDGKTLEKLQLYAKGDPDAPLTEDEYEEKFRMLAGRYYPEEILTKMFAFVKTLDTCEDVREGLAFLTTV